MSHPDLFTGYCETFRKNVIDAVFKTNVHYNEICDYMSADRFCDLINRNAIPKEGELDELIEYLKERGYEWK